MHNRVFWSAGWQCRCAPVLRLCMTRPCWEVRVFHVLHSVLPQIWVKGGKNNPHPAWHTCAYAHTGPLWKATSWGWAGIRVANTQGVNYFSLKKHTSYKSAPGYLLSIKCSYSLHHGYSFTPPPLSLRHCLPKFLSALLSVDLANAADESVGFASRQQLD